MRQHQVVRVDEAGEQVGTHFGPTAMSHNNLVGRPHKQADEIGWFQSSEASQEVPREVYSRVLPKEVRGKRDSKDEATDGKEQFHSPFWQVRMKCSGSGNDSVFEIGVDGREPPTQSQQNVVHRFGR